MLTLLDIQNFVLMDHVTVDVRAGLTALTGETGAGKSMMVDALHLLQGDRADMGLIRPGADAATLCAVYDMPFDHPAWTVLAVQDIAPADTLILKRSFDRQGRGKIWINDQLITLQTLKHIGPLLIDIHSQMAHTHLLDPGFHRLILDQFGGLEHDRTLVAAAAAEVRAAQTALRQAQTDHEARTRDQGYILAQLDKLRDLNPVMGEEEKLLARKQTLTHQAQIQESMADMDNLLHGDHGVVPHLARLARVVDRLRGKWPEADAVLQTLDQLNEPLHILTGQISNAGSGHDDEGYTNLNDLEDRLYALRAQARRLSCAVDDLPAKRQDLEDQLAALHQGSDMLAALALQVQQAQKKYTQAAERLTKKRRAAARDLDTAMAVQLPPLKLEKAIFITDITSDQTDAMPKEGVDQVQFMVAPNPGVPPGPLHKIASGGEMTRLMLALKVVLSGRGFNPSVMVFDEVDSGLSGAVATAVAERLRDLSTARPVIVITHAAQVAALAHHHGVMIKTTARNKTTTTITMLETKADRQEEVARLLSGAEITDAARAAAKQLMKQQAA